MNIRHIHHIRMRIGGGMGRGSNNSHATRYQRRSAPEMSGSVTFPEGATSAARMRVQLRQQRVRLWVAPGA